jgi:hypothetical protein
MHSKKEFYKELSNLKLHPITMKELILVYNKSKPCCRIIIGDSILKQFNDFCKKYSLYIERSNFKIIGQRDIGKGGWQNKIKKKVSVNSKKGYFFYYVSYNKKNAKRAKTAEKSKKEKKFGKLLGFPVCCQNFFAKYYKKANSKQCDFVLYVLKETKENPPYDFWNNYIAQYFGYSLLSHFPCSFNCKESERLAKLYYKKLKENNKKFAEGFKKAQKSAILFTEYRGIFLIRKYNLKGNILIYDNKNLKTTLKNTIFESLKRGDNVKILNKNHVLIRKKNHTLKELRGENIGICIFK